MLLSCSADIIVKALDDSYPLSELLFFRMLFGLIPLALYAAIVPGISLRSARPQKQILRGSISLLTLALWFSALPVLPLAEATTISLLAPIIAAFLSAILLNCAASARQWTGIVIGMIGGTLAIELQIGSFGPGLLLALGATGLRAGSMVMLQDIGREDHPITTALYFCVMGLIVCFLLLPFAFHPPSQRDLPFLLGLGLVTGTSQVLIAGAFRLQSAVSLAPLDYLRLPIASLAGVMIFSETLKSELIYASFLVLIGTVLALSHAGIQVQSRSKSEKC